MIDFRIMAHLDDASGLYAVFVYSPAEAQEPIARSPFRFATDTEAIAFARDLLEEHLGKASREIPLS